MIHGLVSDPITWVKAYNRLHADREIRENFQFWFYFYPSGQPFQESAAELRIDLANLRHTLWKEHPKGDWQPNVNKTVIIGHSMGGLIGRMVTIDSGNRFEQKMFSGQLDVPESTQEMLQKKLGPIYRFPHDPTISRVIAVATPHKGSGYARLRGFALRVPFFGIHPSKSSRLLAEHAEQKPGWLKDERAARTSLDTLHAESPILDALNETRPHRAKLHTIYGYGQDEYVQEAFRKRFGVPSPSWLVEKTQNAVGVALGVPSRMRFGNYSSIRSSDGPFDAMTRLVTYREDATGGMARDDATDTDGIVPVESARMDDDDNIDMAIPANHVEIQKHPQTVQYIRDILLEVLHESTPSANRPRMANDADTKTDIRRTSFEN